MEKCLIFYASHYTVNLSALTLIYNPQKKITAHTTYPFTLSTVPFYTSMYGKQISPEEKKTKDQEPSEMKYIFLFFLKQKEKGT